MIPEEADAQLNRLIVKPYLELEGDGNHVGPYLGTQALIKRCHKRSSRDATRMALYKKYPVTAVDAAATPVPLLMSTLLKRFWRAIARCPTA